MREVICKNCGKTFTTSKPNAIYCSDPCRKDRQREKRIVWEARNPDYYMVYKKRQRAKQKALNNLKSNA